MLDDSDHLVARATQEFFAGRAERLMPQARADLLEGSFTATAEARALSCASVFCGARLPVPARFDFGVGTMPSRRRVAIRCLLPSGADLDLIAFTRCDSVDYFGTDTFVFVDRQARACSVRYRFVPWRNEPLVANHDRDAAAIEDVFDWWAQVATDWDVLADPAIEWPQTRPLIRLGTVHLTGAATGADVDSIVFNPSRLPPGIESAR